MISLADIVNFILQHPSKDLVINKDYTIEDIELTITKSLTLGSLAVVTDKDENIEAICVAEPAHHYRLLHVKILLVKDGCRNSVKTLIRLFNENFNGYDIQAYRHDDLTRYKNTSRLVHLFKLLAN